MNKVAAAAFICMVFSLQILMVFLGVTPLVEALSMAFNYSMGIIVGGICCGKNS